MHYIYNIVTKFLTFFHKIGVHGTYRVVILMLIHRLDVIFLESLAHVINHVFHAVRLVDSVIFHAPIHHHVHLGGLDEVRVDVEAEVVATGDTGQE